MGLGSERVGTTAVSWTVDGTRIGARSSAASEVRVRARVQVRARVRVGVGLGLGIGERLGEVR